MAHSTATALVPLALVLALGVFTAASRAAPPSASSPPPRVVPVQSAIMLASVRGQTVCSTSGRMIVEATIDTGAGGKSTVFVRSSRGAVSSAEFKLEAHQRVTVPVTVADASCASPGSFDVWLSTGGAHKGLVPANVMFVEGAPPSPSSQGSGSVVGNAVGGG